MQGTSVLDGFGILPFEVVSKNIALRPCVQKYKESKFLPKNVAKYSTKIVARALCGTILLSNVFEKHSWHS